MNSWMKKIGLGLALGATALTIAAPADAQRFRGGGYRGGYHGGYYRGGGAGTAVLAGVAGLAVGAALASDRGYYRGGGYGYYGDPYYRGDPYYHHYYRGYYDGYYPRGCFIERRFDPYYGRPVHVRVCR